MALEPLSEERQQKIIELAKEIKALLPDDEELLIVAKGRYISRRSHDTKSGTSQFTVKRRPE